MSLIKLDAPPRCKMGSFLQDVGSWLAPSESFFDLGLRQRTDVELRLGEEVGPSYVFEGQYLIIASIQFTPCPGRLGRNSVDRLLCAHPAGVQS